MRSQIQGAIKLPSILCGTIIATFVIELLLPGNFIWLGIRPRTLNGLPGIFFSPFLHADLKHLGSNILPLFVMACMVSALDAKRFLSTTMLLVFIAGMFTWIFSPSGVVIGASGLVFAYWSFLIANGISTKNWKSLLFALLTILLFGALLFSLFRFQAGVSWVGHVGGVIAGLIVAQFKR